MKDLKTLIKVFFIQKYFKQLSSKVNPSTLGRGEILTLSWFGKILYLIYPKEVHNIDYLCSGEIYNDFSKLRGTICECAHVMNEEIAIFVLKAVFTNYPYSGDYCTKEYNIPILEECMRYIHSNDSLKEIADSMIALHGEPPSIGFADARYEKKQLVLVAVILYRKISDKESILACANYLWKNYHDTRAYPLDRHFLLNLFLEIDTPESRKSLFEIKNYFEYLGTPIGYDEYRNFAEYCSFLEEAEQLSPRVGFLI